MVAERNHPDGVMWNLKRKNMIQNSKKGGRPKKDFGQKKTYRINIKLITEEYYSLIAKVKKAKTTISYLVRDCLKKGYVKERITIEQLGYIRKLCGMANNLNQIARQANAKGYNNVAIEFQSMAERIDNVIKLLEQ